MKARLILLTIAAAAFAACSQEGPEMPQEPVSHAKVLRASLGADTRTSVNMQPGGGKAEVLWNSGDEILVYADSLGLRSYSRTFTTADDGTKAADFSCDEWDVPFEMSACLAFYPAERFRSIKMATETDYYVSVVIPIVQNAVNGGLDRGLNISVAFAPDDSGTLHFKNVLSLVHFTLGGARASEVRRIVFSTHNRISGDGAYVVSAEGGAMNMNLRFNPVIYGASNNVDLVGTFEEGGDYYIAIAPGTTDGFSFTFYDEDGGVISRTSPKTLTTTRSRIVEFGTITVDDDFESLPSGVERYMTQTRGSKPVCLAIIGDGFTAGQQDLFTNLARSAVDLIFDTEPYRTYRDWFNVYIMHAVSNESGGSVTDGTGNITELHDTAFKSSWGTDSYSDLQSDFEGAFSFVSEHCPEIIDGTLTSADVPVLMIINDSRYGGMCYNWEDGHSIAHVPYVNNGSGTLMWQFPESIASDDSDPSAGTRSTTAEEYAAMGGFYQEKYQRWFSSKGNWRHIVVHEYGGHAFGRLDDEYWYDPITATDKKNETIDARHSWEVPFCLNTSGSYDNVPWKAALLDNLAALAEVDARYAARIGRFQGASGYALNRWRSELVSCMIDNRQYFSTWQRMLIVKRIIEKAGETFSMGAFLQNDNPTDRLRDNISANAPRRGEGSYPTEDSEGPYIFCPPLPPPVFINN